MAVVQQPYIEAPKGVFQPKRCFTGSRLRAARLRLSRRSTIIIAAPLVCPRSRPTNRRLRGALTSQGRSWRTARRLLYPKFWYEQHLASESPLFFKVRGEKELFASHL